MYVSDYMVKPCTLCIWSFYMRNELKLLLKRYIYMYVYNIYVYFIYEFNEHYGARANNFSYAGIKSYGTNGSDAAGIR